MRAVKIVMLVALAVSLALPGVLTILGTERAALGGVTAEGKDVKLTRHTFADGSFQKRFDIKFPRLLSIFGTLVKADNQLSLWCFGQLSSNPKSRVIMGRNGHLIERAYLAEFNGEKPPKASKLAAIADEIARLQQILTEHGKALVILISTNKPSFYPQVVPDGYRVPGAEALPSASDGFVELLRARGVEPLDTKTFLRTVEAETKLPLFAETGTHWNQYASCRISAELVSQVGVRLHWTVPSLVCATDGQRKLPHERDMDLLKFANLLFPGQLVHPAPRVVSKVVLPDSGARKPNLLLIGTSFSGELMATLNNNPVFDNREFLYYFNRQILPRSAVDLPLDRAHYDVAAAIERNDAVVLEVNEAFVHRIGYGFIKDALAALEPKDGRRAALTVAAK